MGVKRVARPFHDVGQSMAGGRHALDLRPCPTRGRLLAPPALASTQLATAFAGTNRVSPISMFSSSLMPMKLSEVILAYIVIKL